MVRRKYIYFFLTLVMISGGGIWIKSQWRKSEAQSRSTYYASILSQAPCIEKVCPGFAEGRTRALKHLSESSILKSASLQGESIVNFVFGSGETKTGGGGGGVYFISSDEHQVVHRMAFRLYGLRLATVLETLGEPDKFLFISGCGMGTQVHAELFYPTKGVAVVINYETRHPASQELTNDTPISSIEYFIPNNFQQHLYDSLDRHIVGSVAYDLPLGVTVENVVRQIAPWPGINTRPTPSADFCPR